MLRISAVKKINSKFYMARSVQTALKTAVPVSIRVICVENQGDGVVALIEL